MDTKPSRLAQLGAIAIMLAIFVALLAGAFGLGRGTSVSGMQVISEDGSGVLYGSWVERGSGSGSTVLVFGPDGEVQHHAEVWLEDDMGSPSRRSPHDDGFTRLGDYRGPASIGCGLAGVSWDVRSDMNFYVFVIAD